MKKAKTTNTLWTTGISEYLLRNEILLIATKQPPKPSPLSGLAKIVAVPMETQNCSIMERIKVHNPAKQLEKFEKLGIDESHQAVLNFSSKTRLFFHERKKIRRHVISVEMDLVDRKSLPNWGFVLQTIGVFFTSFRFITDAGYTSGQKQNEQLLLHLTEPNFTIFANTDTVIPAVY